MAGEEDLVTVCSTADAGEVALIKMRLDGAEIPYIAVNDVISTICPIDGMALVKFQVFRRDEEEARELLQAFGLL